MDQRLVLRRYRVNSKPALSLNADLPLLTKISSLLRNMQKGFNSDLQVRGKNYHIQTEDWGHQNPFIVTRVFCSGAVLKTFKTSYVEALKKGPQRADEAIRLALRQQHNQILDQLLSGHL